MDIVEQLARQAAETINGGEFYDGKWYTEGQRQAWRRAMTPAADEIKRLRQLNAELVDAFEKVMIWIVDDQKIKIENEEDLQMIAKANWVLVGAKIRGGE